MARPVTASDDEILSAAKVVLERRGPESFSIAEVANEVGLSRAAIILRFRSTEALKVTLLTKLIDQFDAGLQALPKTPGGDGLLHVGACIGSYAGTREGSAKFFASYTTNVQNRASAASRALFKLEEKRGESLNRAIAAVMPDTKISRESAIEAFRAHLSGSLISWLSMDDDNPRRYLVRRTRDWLLLAGIPFSQALADELAAAPMPARKQPRAAASAPSRSKVAARSRR